MERLRYFWKFCASLTNLPELEKQVAVLNEEIQRIKEEKADTSVEDTRAELDSVSDPSAASPLRSRAMSDVAISGRCHGSSDLERRTALLPGDLSPTEKLAQLEGFLLQGTEVLEKEWKVFQDGGSSSLASFDPRIENAIWRMWQKARGTSPTPFPRFRRRRYVCFGLCVGAAVASAFVLWSRPEEPLLDSTAVGFFAFLNATFNMTEKEEVDEDMPGLLLSKQLKMKHPIVMIPGIVSSGLELWEADECLGAPNFRKRLWGQTSMLRIALQNITCWMHHLKLGPLQADPPNVKLRAATGFDAADYLLANYWVWAKLLENLAMIGYDGNSMRLMPYDWRLSFHRLQERDQFFSRLQAEVELLHEAQGEKVVIIAHSMGVNVWFYFMDWVSKVGRSGAGDSEWIDRHIHSLANLGGPLLGAMGPLTSLLSGEAHMGAMAVLLAPLLRNLLGEDGNLRMRDVARTWGSLYEILPKGGDSVWGTRTDPTDCRCDLITRKGKAPLGVTAAMDLLANLTQKESQCSINANEDYCFREISWDPFRSSLPRAPKLKMFCMYGVGLRTERAYSYTEPTSMDSFGQIDYRAHSGSYDASYAMGAIESARMDYGLSTVDGDGTVPLLSLGYMCKGAWREFQEMNPGGIKPVVREYIDMSSSVLSDTRGGPKSAKHVEMLGNHDVIKDVLHIVAGEDNHLSSEDRIFSRIGEISWRINKRLRQARENEKECDTVTPTTPNEENLRS